MYGEPEDVDGECNARLYIGDNYGDNHATMRCQADCEIRRAVTAAKGNEKMAEIKRHVIKIPSSTMFRW